MKKILISFLLFVISNVYASDAMHVILKRNGKKSKPTYSNVILNDLKGNSTFEGKYFKVVLAQSDKAIHYDLSSKPSKIQIKAATTYYYVTQMRKFWIDKMGSSYVSNLPKIIIRIDIKVPFDEITHFNNFATEEEHSYNNALSIPAGETPDFVDIQDKWGPEIWFRPSKKILTKEIAHDMGPNPLEQSLTVLRDAGEAMAWSNFEYKTLNHLFYPELQSGNYLDSVVRHVGTLFVMWGIVELSKHSDSLFLDKYYYMDTALIPEVIYHEYNHIALGDFLSNTHSTAVIEGMADYFTMAINPQKKLMAPLKGISNNAPKKPFSKTPYTTSVEQSDHADSDIALATLWAVNQAMGSDGHKLIYESRKFMNSRETDLLNGMPKALNNACSLLYKNTRLCRRKIIDVLSIKGF